MAIYGVGGKPGTGKTYWCVAHMVKKYFEWDKTHGEYMRLIPFKIFFNHVCHTPICFSRPWLPTYTVYRHSTITSFHPNHPKPERKKTKRNEYRKCFW